MKYLMTIATILLSAALGHAAMFGADILEGKGDFDDPGDQTLIADGGIWSFFNGRGTGSFAATYPQSPDYHFYAQETGANGDVRLNGAIDFFANRAYKLSWSFRKVGSTGSAYQYRTSANSSWTSYSAYWGYADKIVTLNQPDSTTVTFSFQMYGDGATGDDGFAIDDVTLLCEQSNPIVTSDNFTGMTVGQQTTVSLFNAGGDDGTYSVNFDPDIFVTSAQASGITTTWVSDQQIDVTFTPNASTVCLMLNNDYSDLSTLYTIPEPATLLLLSLGSLVLKRK